MTESEAYKIIDAVILHRSTKNEVHALQEIKEWLPSFKPTRKGYYWRAAMNGAPLALQFLLEWNPEMNITDIRDDAFIVDSAAGWPAKRRARHEAVKSVLVQHARRQLCARLSPDEKRQVARYACNLTERPYGLLLTLPGLKYALITRIVRYSTLEAPDFPGLSPWSLTDSAIRQNEPRILRFLRESGCNTDKCLEDSLGLVMSRDHPPTLRQLLLWCPPWVKKYGYQGAARYGAPHAMKILLDRNSNVNATELLAVVHGQVQHCSAYMLQRYERVERVLVQHVRRQLCGYLAPDERRLVAQYVCDAGKYLDLDVPMTQLRFLFREGVLTGRKIRAHSATIQRDWTPSKIQLMRCVIHTLESGPRSASHVSVRRHERCN